MSAKFADEIIPHLTHLRAFARMLAQDQSLADDLVQETVVRALSHSHQFQPGTNLKAWLTTILRNTFFTEKRSQGRLVQFDPDGTYDSMITNGDQKWHMYMCEFKHAFRTLPEVQREAVVLVGASGFSYEEAAEIAHCAVGTMKSRVSRARLRLQNLLEGNERVEKEQTHARDLEHLMGNDETAALYGALMPAHG